MSRRGTFIAAAMLVVLASASNGEAADPAALDTPGVTQEGQPAPRGRVGGPLGGARRGAPLANATAENAEALFERYVRRQARVALQLTPAEMRVLEPKLQHLQSTRRRLLRERQRHLNELALATRGSSPAEASTIRERLEAFEAFKVSADEQLREAMAAVDEVLTIEQRARFRVFERRMERQKLELMARARREAATPPAELP